jgi:hypothetical protein
MFKINYGNDSWYFNRLVLLGKTLLYKYKKIPIKLLYLKQGGG